MFDCCPECSGEIEKYDTNPDGKGGRYRCKQCGRDTEWQIGKAMSIVDLLQTMKNNIKE